MKRFEIGDAVRVIAGPRAGEVTEVTGDLAPFDPSPNIPPDRRMVPAGTPDVASLQARRGQGLSLARAYHSPSSIALGYRCMAAWARVYLEGLRPPDRAWDEIRDFVYDRDAKLWRAPDGEDTCTNRARSTALGKAVHTRYEEWYGGDEKALAGDRLEAQIARSGAHLLPQPSRCQKVIPEGQIGDRAPERMRRELPPGDRPDSPRVALVIDGVPWAGFRDLVAYSPAEVARLFGQAHDGWMLGDYKSTASIANYALTPEELLADVQGNVYAIDVGETIGLRVVPAQWTYLETKAVRRAAPTRVLFNLDRAYEALAPFNALARELDTLRDVKDAPMNPLACCDYGPPGKINCEHHVSNGGTCPAKRSIGALVQARVRKPQREDTPQMALPANIADKFKKRAAEGAAPAAAAAPSTPPPAAASEPEASEDRVDPTAEAEVREAFNATQAPLRTEPAGDEGKATPVAEVQPTAATAPKAATKKKAPNPTDSSVTRVAELAQELVRAQANLEMAQQNVDMVKAAMREALA